VSQVHVADFENTPCQAQFSFSLVYFSLVSLEDVSSSRRSRPRRRGIGEMSGGRWRNVSPGVARRGYNWPEKCSLRPQAENCSVRTYFGPRLCQARRSNGMAAETLRCLYQQGSGWWIPFRRCGATCGVESVWAAGGLRRSWISGESRDEPRTFSNISRDCDLGHSVCSEGQ